jgi:hypothetical protein
VRRAHAELPAQGTRRGMCFEVMRWYTIFEAYYFDGIWCLKCSHGLEFPSSQEIERGTEIRKIICNLAAIFAIPFS